MAPTRPGPLRWLWYALGGGLPSRYRAWVLHDATCRTWHVRHFARVLVQFSPTPIPIFLIIPGPRWIPLLALLLGFLVAMRYALFTLHGSVEHRVQKAGYPPGTAQAVRDRATAAQRAEADARYALRYRRGTPEP